jgi:aryl sulfotransferase
MRVVWIASYPKSGNTWVRFLLHHYLYGPVGNSLELNRRIPDLHRPSGRIDTGAERLLVKTHLALTDGLPFLAQTERAIHIRRDPRDVLLSGMHYAGLEAGRTPDPVAYARAFIECGGDPGWAKMGFGTWAGHAEGWLTADRFPVHATTYEALKADTPGELRRMLEFLGEPIDATRVAEAVELSDFERLRELERREKARGGESLFRGGRESLRRGAMFMRKGQTGQRLDEVAPGLDAAFDEAFDGALARVELAAASLPQDSAAPEERRE